MAEIRGFMKDQKRRTHYDNVVNLYNTWKKGKELYAQGSEADPSETPF